MKKTRQRDFSVEWKRTHLPKMDYFHPLFSGLNVKPNMKATLGFGVCKKKAQVEFSNFRRTRSTHVCVVCLLA